MKYKEGRSITEYTSEFQGLVDQLTTIKIILDDELYVFLLVSSLFDNWETLVVSVNNLASNRKLTLDIVIDSLRNKESRKKSVEAVPSKSDVLVSEKQEKQGKGQSRNSRQQNNNNPRERSKSQRRNLKCFHCQKMGHVKRECRLWKENR